MKRWFALFVVLPLLLGAASAKTYRVENAFALTYPQEWTYDNVTYCQDNTEESIWLVDLYDDQFSVGVYMDYYPDWEEFSLFSASEREIRRYAEDLVEQLTDGEGQAEWIDTIRTPSGVPFVLLTVEDADGQYLCAETMASGWAIYLFGYASWEEEISPEYAEAFREIVSSFRPMQ